jgi:Lipase (class 3)
MKKTLLLFCAIAMYFIGNGQQLKAGFDAKEYADLMQFSFKGFSDTGFAQMKPSLQRKYQHLFISPEVGLANKCEMYLRDDNVGIINLRGTVAKTDSWLANFFAGMIKAKGSLQINDSTNFTYQLANDDNAYIHVGWMIVVAHLAPYLTHCMDSLLAKGVRSFIVSGHSQGGALAFLTTSYLHYKYKTLYPNLQLKTYASAAPKPGNLYYAYDFDFITANGYGFRIVNTADWVPESPLTVQTLKDFNEANPLKDAKQTLKKQKFFVRLYLNHIYNKMDNASTKTMKRYRKYLGNTLAKIVKKSLPQFQKPAFVYSSNYMTAGTPIILYADTAYLQKFVFTGKNYFIHHMYQPYMYLLRQYYKVD